MGDRSLDSLRAEKARELEALKEQERKRQAREERLSSIRGAVEGGADFMSSAAMDFPFISGIGDTASATINYLSDQANATEQGRSQPDMDWAAHRKEISKQKEGMAEIREKRSPTMAPAGSWTAQTLGAWSLPMIKGAGILSKYGRVAMESFYAGIDQLLRDRGPEAAQDDAAVAGVVQGVIEGAMPLGRGIAKVAKPIARGVAKGGRKVPFLGEIADFGEDVAREAGQFLPGGEKAPDVVNSVYAWMSGIGRPGGAVEPDQYTSFLQQAGRRQDVKKMGTHRGSDPRSLLGKTERVVGDLETALTGYRKRLGEDYGNILQKYYDPKSFSEVVAADDTLKQMRSLAMDMSEHPSSYSKAIANEIRNTFNILGEGIAKVGQKTPDSFKKIRARVKKQEGSLRVRESLGELSPEEMALEVAKVHKQKIKDMIESVSYMKETMWKSRKRLGNLLDKKTRPRDAMGRPINITPEDEQMINSLRGIMGDSMQNNFKESALLKIADGRWSKLEKGMEDFIEHAGKKKSKGNKYGVNLDQAGIESRLKRGATREQKFWESVDKIEDHIQGANDPIVVRAMQDAELQPALNMLRDLRADYDMKHVLDTVQRAYGPTGQAVDRLGNIMLLTQGGKAAPLFALFNSVTNPYAMTNLVDRLAALKKRDPRLIKATIKKAVKAIERKHHPLLKRTATIMGRMSRDDIIDEYGEPMRNRPSLMQAPERGYR